MKIKVKAKEKGGVVKVKMLIKHDMETGRRKDSEGQIIPAHFVTEITVEHKGKTVIQSEFGTAVSKDPFIAFSFKGSMGDVFNVSAIDNLGETGQAEVTVK